MTLIRSCGPDWLNAKLTAGEILIIDGAMGTELEARGVPMHAKAWSAAAIKTHPDVVRETHADYIRSGARVIISNTFATGRHMLEPADLGDEVANINRILGGCCGLGPQHVSALREAVEIHFAFNRPGGALVVHNVKWVIYIESTR